MASGIALDHGKLSFVVEDVMIMMKNTAFATAENAQKQKKLTANASADRPRTGNRNG
jgi:hypothetical protein